MSRKKPTKEEEKKRIERIRTRFIENYCEKHFREADLDCTVIVDRCSYENTTFHDEEFPHKPDIYLRKSNLWEKFQNFITCGPKLEWIRPVVAFPLPICDQPIPGIRTADRYDPWTILEDPKASDVHQRGIGDCCLIAAISVIAEQPGILDKIFPRQEVSKYGVYEVRLCHSGEWKSVIVDDWLLARGDELITARTGNNQLWVSLIEKAIAKIYGGYHKISGIDVVESLTMLTGFPCHQFKMENFTEDQVWEMLVSARAVGDAITTSVSRRTHIDTELALHNEHAYSLLDVKMFEGHRLIRLRNPWGNYIWTGKWSILWKGWQEYHPQKRIELNGSVDNTSVFGECWMEIDDFLKYFFRVTICRHRPHWYSICVKTVVGGEIDDRNQAIRITVEETCQVCFSAYAQFGIDDGCGSTLLSICRLDETGKVGEVMNVFFLHARLGSSPDIWLESGNYGVMPTKFRIPKEERNIVIHSSKRLNADLIPLNPKVMVESVQKFVQKSGKPVKLTTPSASIHKFWFTNEVMMILAENRSINQYFHVNVYYDRHEFEYSSTRFQYSDKQEDTIPPMSRQIIFIFTRRTLKKIDMKIDLEYSMSSEEFGKYGRRYGKAHVPDLDPFDYIHAVLSINTDSE